MYSSFTRRVVTGAVGLCLSIFSLTAPAQSPTRPFQMSILASTDVLIYNASVDIPIFTQHVWSVLQEQPPGRSIAWLPPDRNIDRHYIGDWKRIVAVYVDEPYAEFSKNGQACWSNDEDENRINDKVEAMIAELEAMAAAVRAKAPSARFWVNFSPIEIAWMLDPLNHCPLNQPYIDVMSMDIYGVDFVPTISSKYDALWNKRPTSHQQFALVPGTFTEGWANQNDADADRRLSGYFLYARSMNWRCDLPLGPTGVTGIYDGCPVWMVAGWIGGVSPYPEGSVTYYPIEHSKSTQTRAAWERQFAIPRVDPTQAKRVRALMPVISGE